MIQHYVMSMAGRWISPLAGALFSGPGLMVIAAVVAALYLVRTLSKKLTDKVGIGIGPLLAIGLLVVACFGLKGGTGGANQLAGLLPSRLSAAKAAANAQVRKEQQEAGNQVDAVLNNAIMAMAGTGPVVPPLPAPVATPVNTGRPPSYHSVTLPHAGTAAHTAHYAVQSASASAAPAVAGAQAPASVSAQNNAGPSGGIAAPPPGWDYAPPAPALVASQSKRNPKDAANPAGPGTAAAATSPLPSAGTARAGSAAAARLPAGAGATTSPKTSLMDRYGKQPSVPAATQDKAGTIAATTRAPGLRQQRQPQAQPFGGPGDNATGTGGGSGALARSDAASEAAHTLARRRQLRQERYARTMASDDGGMGMNTATGMGPMAGAPHGMQAGGMHHGGMGHPGSGGHTGTAPQNHALPQGGAMHGMGMADGGMAGPVGGPFHPGGFGAMPGAHAGGMAPSGHSGGHR
jgi:hypothetical protein